MAEDDTKLSNVKDDAKSAKLKRSGFSLPLVGCVPNFGEQKSVAAVLYLAMFADGVEDPEEAQEIVALMRRARTFTNSSQKRQQALLEAVTKEAKARTSQNTLEIASRYFRGRKRKGKHIADSVFMHAADIVLADRNFKDAEKKMLSDLAFYLQIKSERATELYAKMALKNRH